MLRISKALVFALLVSAPSFGQAWSGILAPSRAINWSVAGLPASFIDGETTANPWTPPSRTACTSSQAGTTVPIPATASVSTINSAISACSSANPNGSYLLLSSGTFNVNALVALYNVANVTLRGSGAEATILSLSGIAYVAMGGASGSGAGVLSSSYAAGTSSIIVTGVTGVAPVIDGVANLTQCDNGAGSSISSCTSTPVDNGSLFECGNNSVCDTDGTNSSSFAHENQTSLLTSVTNNGGGSYTFGISPALYMPDWSTSRGASVSWQTPAYDAVGVGLEDMTIEYPGISSQNYLVQMSRAYASWVKGVRFVGTGANSDVAMTSYDLNCLVFNNYFAPGATSLSSRYPYGLFGSGDTNVLVLNNIFAIGLPIELQGQNSGNVIAYNFARDGFTLYPENVLAFDHSAFSSFDLWEGNQSSSMTEDNIWGTHALNTYFRNNIQCSDYPYVTYSGNSYRALNLNGFQRFENAVGNALGTNTTLCGTYQGTGYGTIFQILTGDPLVASTLLRWGNVSVAHQSSDTPPNSGVRFVSSEVPSSLSSPNTSWENPVPSSDNLPCSFFITGSAGASPCSILTNGGTGLSWWKVCDAWTSFPTSCATSQTQPFPPTGPDRSGGNFVDGYSSDVPASIAWQNLPVDPSYQNSYTITGSSWSGGLETLTVSGLPSGSVYLQGAFQLAGVNPACTAGATFNSSNEILMTGSSATTVIYALASNPGVSCTGTFGFPDVRQFDERVYEADTSTLPSPPTNLLATAH